MPDEATNGERGELREAIVRHGQRTSEKTAQSSWNTVDLKIGGLNVRVREIGRGPSVLAIHGLGGSGRYWTRLGITLAPEFRVIAPDLPGFGDSDKPPIAYTPQFFVDVLGQALRSLQSEALFAVVGHSLGGVLGLACSVRGSPRVGRLVLCGVPYPTEPSRNRGDYLRSPLSRFLICHRAFGRLSHEVGCRLLPRLLYLIHRGDYPREIMEDFHKHTHHSYTDTAERCLFRFDIRPALAAVKQLPALLIYSAIDREVPLRDAERYAVAFPHSDRLIVRRPHELVPIGIEHQVKEWLMR